MEIMVIVAKVIVWLDGLVHMIKVIVWMSHILEIQEPR